MILSASQSPHDMTCAARLSRATYLREEVVLGGVELRLDDDAHVKVPAVAVGVCVWCTSLCK